MTSEQLQTAIQQIEPAVTFNEEGPLEVMIEGDKLLSLLNPLRENQDMHFDYLYCLTGVDWPDHMSVVYHLRSTLHQHEIIVKATIPDREKPEISTVSHIWRTAEFHEREVYDLFGIVFQNHPDLRRIFLEDDWVGWPLRKDYVDEINIVEL